jgi:hypothetical protein
MKSVVVACKGITEDVDLAEDKFQDLGVDSELQSLKSKLSVALTQLMSAAKNHATGFGTAPVDLLETSTYNLNGAIVNLLSRIQTKGSPLTQVPSPYSTDDTRQSEISDERFSVTSSPSRISDVSAKTSNLEIDELKVYLEQQTDLIVQAIQTLLRSMRKSSYGTEFQDTVLEINDIVTNLVTISRKAFLSGSGLRYSESGEHILRDLTQSNNLLRDLGKNIGGNPSSKQLKQQLASASYELAKFTKELVSLIE